MKILFPEFAVALVLGASGCGQQIDIAAETEAVLARSDGILAAEAAMDAEGATEFYAYDAIMQPAGAPVIRGREAIAESYRQLFEDSQLKEFILERSHLTVSQGGDLAYDYGVNQEVRDGPVGDVVDVGKYLLVWEKIDGEWMIVALTFSRDGPVSALQGVSHPQESVTYAPPGRRVVTGVDASGKSVVISDGLVPEDARVSFTGGGGGDLWIIDRVPVDLTDQSDPISGYSMQTWPPPGGVIARKNTWEPGFSYPLHRSDTIDFIFVISGQLELILDEGSTVLSAGETVVQRGTNHGWRVVGDEPCTFAAVLIDAAPQTP